MMPITDAHLQEHIQNLNHLHVQNGASGYAKVCSRISSKRYDSMY